jgi:hypothetical protein
MGVVNYPFDKRQYPDVEGKCHICGGLTDAYWMGLETTFEVCYVCAVEKLPLIIADAVSKGPPDSAQHALDRVSGAFWRGLWIRLAAKEAVRSKQAAGEMAELEVG